MTGAWGMRAPNGRHGVIDFRRVEADPRLGYFLYLPSQLSNTREIIVAIHGISRNALQQMEHYQGIADRFGVALMAPLFDKGNFAGFQTLGIGRPGLRADIMFNKAVNEVARLLDVPLPALHLCGYSGGAQFALRYALGQPRRVATLTLCAPGWYTFPDAGVGYPRGLKVGKLWPPYRPDVAGLLRIPLQVIVGERDVKRDGTINCRPTIDRQQGLHRLQRARNWLRAMQALKQEQGLRTPTDLIVLPGQEHDFVANMREGGMGRYIARHIGSATQLVKIAPGD